MRSVKQIAYNRSTRKSSIKYIVIHDTGNKSAGANTKAHYNYFNGGNRNSSADIFVDDHEILVVNDYTKYYTWHCGDGKGKYGITNANSIGIEMCINSDSDRDKALSNMVTITKELMRELNVPIDRVVRHYDASRKNCPQTMASNNWQEWTEFKNRLKDEGGLDVTQYEELKKMISELKPVVFNNVNEVPEWGRPTIEKLIKAGQLQGSADGLNLSMDMLRTFVILDRGGVLK